MCVFGEQLSLHFLSLGATFWSGELVGLLLVWQKKTLKPTAAAAIIPPRPWTIDNIHNSYVIVLIKTFVNSVFGIFFKSLIISKLRQTPNGVSRSRWCHYRLFFRDNVKWRLSRKGPIKGLQIKVHEMDGPKVPRHIDLFFSFLFIFRRFIGFLQPIFCKFQSTKI